VQLQKKRNEAKKVFLHCKTEPHRKEWKRLAGSTAASRLNIRRKSSEHYRESYKKSLLTEKEDEWGGRQGPVKDAFRVEVVL